MSIIHLIFIVLFGLGSIFIPIYTLIKKDNKAAKNATLITYSFLVLTFIVCLLAYLTFHDSSALLDVGGVLARCSIILWIVVLVLLIINENIRKTQINEIKYLSMMTFNLVLAQYAISYYMLVNTNDNAASLKSPINLVIVFAVAGLCLIAHQWIKKNK